MTVDNAASRCDYLNMIYLTPKQAAAKLNISVGTLANWRHLDKGPRYVKVGRAVRYPVDGILEFAGEAQ